MKTILVSFVFSLFAFNALCQKEIAAQKIMAGINQKQNTQYDGVVITGDLDFTELDSKKRISMKDWDGEAYKSVVEVPVVFRNCTFKGNVIAYKSLKNGKRFKIVGLMVDGNSGITYSADFENIVVFENCKFEQDSEFKYSSFGKRADFSGTTFGHEANFKYAQFGNISDFSGANFSGVINFKYANFSSDSRFEKVDFNAYTDFKYTHFKNAVLFDGSVFKAYTDFKYAHFAAGSSLNDVDFRAGSDFKYSNGKKMR
jgi:uncharacterized protein YjbI with pentapeptide repeats